MTSSNEILTIGHSSLSYDHFLSLLKKARVGMIVDVRSAPFSRRNPQFNRADLSTELSKDRVGYVFLGNALGGRPKDSGLFSEGTADYEKMAQSALFQKGLKQLQKVAETQRVALMCSEGNPLNCHRCLLVGRALSECGIPVRHILVDGRIVSHADAEDRLLEISKADHADFFLPRSERLKTAYRMRARKVAYSEQRSYRGDDAAAE